VSERGVRVYCCNVAFFCIIAKSSWLDELDEACDVVKKIALVCSVIWVGNKTTTTSKQARK